MIYLASPYSHPDPSIRANRVRRARDYVLLQKLRHPRELVFSPIVYMNALFGSLENVPEELRTHHRWHEMNCDAIAKAREMRILLLEGAKNSEGIAAEIAFAKETQTPIRWVHPVGQAIIHAELFSTGIR